MRHVLLVIALGFLVSCTDPLISIPGGQLKGELTPTPTSWSAIPDVVQLEVRPNDPYSFNIWAVVSDGDVFVATRAAKWVPMLDASNEVRLKIDDAIYELKATRVTEMSQLETIAQVYYDKYAYDEPWNPETTVFRLTPR